MIVRTLLVILLCSGFWTTSAWGQLKTTETEDVDIIYTSPLHKYLLPQLVSTFTNSYNFHRNLFGYTPTENISILMQDFGDFGHGGADALPTNNVNIGIGPFNYVYETMPASERMNWLMHHELTHIVTTDMPNKRDRFWRGLFRGKVSTSIDDPLSIMYSYLTNPRRYAPRWYHEGSAVFMESWMANTKGRVFGAYDEMAFRTKVRDNAIIYDIVGLESEGKTTDFQIGVNSYLYGTRFISYVANTHGPEKFIEWVSRPDDSKAYFTSQFKKVFDVSIDQAWANWIVWERDFQNKNLELIRQYPTTPFRPVSNMGLGSVSKGFFDEKTGKIYLGVFYPAEVSQIAAVDVLTGKMEKVADIYGAAIFFVTSAAFDPEGGNLFYTMDNGHWRDLWVVNVNTKKVELLVKDLRSGYLAFNRADKSLWGIRNSDGYSTVIRLEPPYENYKSIKTFGYGGQFDEYDVHTMDISPDGNLLSIVKVDMNGIHRLMHIPMSKALKGDFSGKQIFDFDSSAPENFVFSPDGKYQYGSSYYSGVSNIFRYDMELDTVVAVSNCETGFFRPIPYSEDSLIVMRYTGEGFMPVMIPNQEVEDVSAVDFMGWDIYDKHPIVQKWATKASPDMDLDKIVIHEGDYNPMSTFGLASIYPVVQAYKDPQWPAYGLRMNFMSKLGLNKGDLTITYSPQDTIAQDQKIHFLGTMKFNILTGPLAGSWTFSGGKDASDFYDLFGPTINSRKGSFFRTSFSKTVDKELPIKMSTGLSVYGGFEELPDFQDRVAAYDKFFSGNLSFSHYKARRTLGSIDQEKGRIASLSFSSTYVPHDTSTKKMYTKINGNFSYGLLLPIVDHLPFWIRASAGYSLVGDDHSTDPNSSFGEFYFGGFGNNWIDHQGIKRYREYYPFPGAGITSIGATNYVRIMGELILPPLRFRHVGTPFFYLNWARMSLFSSVLQGSDMYSYTDAGEKMIRFKNIGVQIDIRLVLFSYMQSTLSIGYGIAQGYINEKSNWHDFKPETMISLQILD